jgi:type IV secretion system protein VirD4
MTVQTISETLTAGEGNNSRSYSETGRSLMFPDEIIALGPRVAFGFMPEGRARYIRPIDYRDLANYLGSYRKGLNLEFGLPDLTAFDINPFYEGPERPQERGGMTREEALRILGLKEGATASQVKEAYGRLIRKVHPDAGGTDYFAQLLNNARDLLLGKK